MPPGPIPRVRQWTKRDWARYQAFKRRLYMRHKHLVAMYERLHDLYGQGWESAETWIIREECEEVGLPMGYGRVGRPPQQLAWGIATASDQRVDWDGFKDGVEQGDAEE